MEILLDIKPHALDMIKKAFKENFHGDLTEESIRNFIVYNINVSLQDKDSEWYDILNLEDFFIQEDYEPIWVD